MGRLAPFIHSATQATFPEAEESGGPETSGIRGALGPVGSKPSGAPADLVLVSDSQTQLSNKGGTG